MNYEALLFIPRACPELVAGAEVYAGPRKLLVPQGVVKSRSFVAEFTLSAAEGLLRVTERREVHP